MLSLSHPIGEGAGGFPLIPALIQGPLRAGYSPLDPGDDPPDDWPLLPMLLATRSHKITNDAGVPLDSEHAYTKLLDAALWRTRAVLRMLWEHRPIISL